MFAVSEPGLIAVVVVLVLLFGSQLPKIARNLGTAGKEFRKAQQEAEEEERERQSPQASGAVAPPAPLPPAPAPPAASQASAANQATPASSDESMVTLSRSELDALLKAREEQAREQARGESG